MAECPPIPQWATGMKMLVRGVYCEPNGHLHLDLSEMCRAAGVEPSQVNCETMAQMAREMFADLGTTVEEDWHEEGENNTSWTN